MNQISEVIEWVTSFKSSDVKWLVTVLLTLLGLYIAFKKLKKSIPKPELVIQFYPGMSVIIRGFTKDKRDISFVHHNNEGEEFEARGILYRIENIGPGMAKNVSIEWNFDLQFALKMLSIYARPLLEVVEHNHGVDILNNEGKELVSTMFYSLDHPTFYKFISPRDKEKFNKSPNLCETIAELFVIYFLLKKDILTEWRIDSELLSDELEDFPTPVAIVSYEDLEDRKYKKEYKTSLSISTGLLDEQIDLSAIDELYLSIYIEVEESR